MCRIRPISLILPAPQKFSSNSDLNVKKYNSQNRAPPPLDPLDELGGVRAACRLPLLDVVRIIQELEEGVEAVAQEIALCPLADLADDVAADAGGGSRATRTTRAKIYTCRRGPHSRHRALQGSAHFLCSSC